jgi:hypothetical protein
VGILASVAIPNFIDFRTDAKNQAVRSIVGSFRSSIAIAIAAVVLREDQGTSPPKYPSLSEMWGNAFLSAGPSSHPSLASAGFTILNASTGVPSNPWTITTLPTAQFNSVYDCTSSSKGVLQATPLDNRGWCYNGGSTGQVWANSNRNGATTTENSY